MTSQSLGEHTPRRDAFIGCKGKLFAWSNSAWSATRVLQDLYNSFILVLLQMCVRLYKTVSVYFYFTFILVLLQLCGGLYGWGAASEYRLKIGVCARTGSVWSNILGRRGRPLPTIFCQKIRMNDLSYDIIMWAQLPFVLSQSTRLTDGQPDGRTDRRTQRQSQYCTHCVALHVVAITDMRYGVCGRVHSCQVFVLVKRAAYFGRLQSTEAR